VGDVELDYFRGVNGFFARNEDGCFAAVVVGDRQDHIKAFRDRELCNKVEGNGFERKGIRGRCNWVNEGSTGVRVDFVHLAGGASSNVLGSELLHVGPPVVFGGKFKGFGNSGVASSGRIVKEGNYSPPQIVICHNDKGRAAVLEVAIRCQVMRVLPSFKGNRVVPLGNFDLRFKGWGI
jgi:hypothetical protein